jgi:hypothetical protein
MARGEATQFAINAAGDPFRASRPRQQNAGSLIDRSINTRDLVRSLAAMDPCIAIRYCFGGETMSRQRQSFVISPSLRRGEELGPI